METTKNRGMTGLDEDPVHGLDAGDEDPRETARKQIQFLEEGLDPAATGRTASALLDEAYRAAHLLRSALDPARSPNVIRIARQIQALVTAVRKGHIPPGPGVLSLLRTAAHAAGDSVEALVRGKRENPSAEEAAAALETFLGGAFAALPIVPDGSGPARYTRVEAGRLESARAATGSAAAAVAAYSRSAEEAARAEGTLRSHAERRSLLAAEVLAAIPHGLAAAARGEPVTVIAQELAGRISSLAALDAESGDAIARLTARMREAGDAGSRAMDDGFKALAGIGGVGIRSVLHGIEPAARGALRSYTGTVQMRVELGDGEIDASHGPQVKTALLQAIRALLDPARGKKSSAANSRKGPPPVKVEISIEAESKEGQEYIRLFCSGSTASAAELSPRLTAIAQRLNRQKVDLRVEKRRGDRVSLLLTVPSFRRVRSGEASFLVVRAKGALHAIPSESIVECIPAPAPAGSKGSPVFTIALGEAANAGAGVVMRGATTNVVVLVDALVGEEALRTDGKEPVPGAPRSGTRSDGTRIEIIDLPVLLSSRSAAARTSGTTTKAVKRSRAGPAAAHRARAQSRRKT